MPKGWALEMCERNEINTRAFRLVWPRGSFDWLCTWRALDWSDASRKFGKPHPSAPSDPSGHKLSVSRPCAVSMSFHQREIAYPKKALTRCWLVLFSPLSLRVKTASHDELLYHYYRVWAATSAHQSPARLRRLSSAVLPVLWGASAARLSSL